jgi:hypothetical protein
VEPLPAVDTFSAIEILHRRESAPRQWTELLLGSRTSIDVGRDQAGSPAVLFPGAFNPPHWGHRQMAEIASQRLGAPVTFELSITNVDKPPLDFIEIANRLKELASERVLLTRAPTFVEKSRLAPGCTFVVGVDTIERIADPVYYNHDETRRDAAIAEIASRACRFLVFGRAVDGRFTPLSGAAIPGALRDLCEEVPEGQFSADVSSTGLRRAESE